MLIWRKFQNAREVLNTGQRLGLGRTDRVKYALSWYLRRPLLRALAPSWLMVRLPQGAQAVLRTNGVDWKTLEDVFGRRLYAITATDTHRILDLGANIGLSTLFLSIEFPGATFACVEPSPANRAVLEETIRRNRIQATIIESAIGVETGEAELHLGSDPAAFSLVPAEAEAKVIRVRQVTAPDVLEQLGWEEIDLMKIDIEGYEKTLFRSNNAWLGRVRRIIGEAHGHVGYGIEEVRADLAPFGFRVTLKSFEPRYGLTIFEAAREV